MIRQTLFAGLFLIAGLLGTHPVHADAAGEALVSDALNAIAAAPGWTATSDVVRSDGDSVIVEGLSIVNLESKITVLAGTIELTGLASRDRGYFASGATVRDLTVSYDLSSMVQLDNTDMAKTSMANTVRAQSLAITDLYLPSGVGSGTGQSGIFAPLVAFYSYLANVEMASMSVPEMVNEQTIALPDLDETQSSRVTYYDSRITNWSDGIIARYDLGRIEMEMAGGQAGDVAMGAESAFAEHIDMAHMAHVMDPANYAGGRGDGVWKPVLTKAEYAGIRVNAGEIEVSIARLGLSDFDMRQPEKPFLTVLESAVASGIAGQQPDEAAALAMMKDLVPSIFGAFRIGEMRMQDLQGRPIVSSKPGGFALQDLTIAGYSGQGIDRFSIEGLSATGPDNITVKLGSLGFNGLVFPDWKNLFEFAEAAQQGEDPAKNPQLVGKLLDLYPSIDSFAMLDMSGNAPGKEPFRIDEISFEVTGRMGTFMASGKGAIRGFVFPASYFDEGGGPNPLRMLNYDRLALDYVFESVWDEDTTELDHNSVISVEDVGELTIGYGLSGITEAAMRKLFVDIIELESSGQDEDPARIMALVQDLGFTGFSFSFADRSIIERALALVASQQGSDGPTYRDQLKAALPFFLSGMPPVDFRQQAIEAAQAALDGGQKTTFSLMPGRTLMAPEIISAGMQDPLSLIDLLGARIVSQPMN